MQNKDFTKSEWNWATKKICSEMGSLQELEHSG